MHTRRKYLWSKNHQGGILCKAYQFKHLCNTGKSLSAWVMYFTNIKPVSGLAEFVNSTRNSWDFTFFTYLLFPKLFIFSWTLVHGYWDIKDIFTVKILKLMNCDLQFVMYIPLAAAAGCMRLAAVTTCKHICSDCSFLNWNSANFCCLWLLCGNLPTNSCFDKW